MSEQLYNPTYINPLITSLRDEVTKLNTVAGEMEHGYTEMQNAWIDPNSGETSESFTGFNTVYQVWKTDFSDTAAQLTDLANKVETALQNATTTDQKVGDWFIQ
ncbi:MULTISPECIES: hypothetical protein [Nocardia]|uniref:WXG100 family type VII secretion target n=1 Tax=Nocardia TaxID=1817 RepID=UPI0015EFBCBC|nr:MULTISPECIES: hypothetical protein [Nocardia]MCA2210227.1 hypothetical protein [Nocardia rosealba]